MIKPTELLKHVNPERFLADAMHAFHASSIEKLLTELPIVDDDSYVFRPEDPADGWREGFLHWYPVGGERGNAGRIKLAGSPENPIAERTVNAFEALIELKRQLELRAGRAEPPESPRDAVRRYFNLPPLSEIPEMHQLIAGQRPRNYVREIAKRIRIKLVREGRPAQYSVAIEDDGIGQSPDQVHRTLLSLGRSDKGEKPYLIGVFGQGGSSAYSACTYSWVVSRRHPELTSSDADGIGWTVIKHVYPKRRRDDYFAYLAAHPDGRVPALPATSAEALSFRHGTAFAHVNYDFGRTEPARRLYPALNHLLFDPILPYELYTGPKRKADPMYGNGYRLTLNRKKQVELDKTFRDQIVRQ